MSVRMYFLYVGMYARMYGGDARMCVCVSLSLCLRVCLSARPSVCECVYVYVCMHVCMYACMHACIGIYRYVAVY